MVLNYKSTLKAAALCLLLSLSHTGKAQLADCDLNAPFGWANCSSMTSGDDYTVTGGGDSDNCITLKSTGEDMRSTISSALSKYDVIIFDGSDGDFIVSYSIDMNSLKDKTIVGVNGARLCTQFYLTDEIRKALDDAKVKSASTSSGTGGTLSNGQKVDEERELLTRQTIIDLTGDASEKCRKAGIFNVKKCNNIIIRNIKFVGPGPCDVGGYDLMSSTGTTHLWVDHCDFTDGIDGNFDITQESDFVTVSWCTFSYTDRAYDHMNTNLVGSSDSNTKDMDKLNITFANNIWGYKCSQRMPMARFGTIHLLNNYYNCAGCSGSVNPRKDSEFLIEGNYFEKGVKKIFSQSGSKAYNFKDNFYTEKFSQPSDKGSVKMPYRYTTMTTEDVPTALTAKNGAGATLTAPLTIGRETDGIETVDNSRKVSCTVYYTSDGIMSYSPVKGLNIVKDFFDDGSYNVRKVVIR